MKRLKDMLEEIPVSKGEAFWKEVATMTAGIVDKFFVGQSEILGGVTKDLQDFKLK